MIWYNRIVFLFIWYIFTRHDIKNIHMMVWMNHFIISMTCWTSDIGSLWCNLSEITWLQLSFVYGFFFLFSNTISNGLNKLLFAQNLYWENKKTCFVGNAQATELFLFGLRRPFKSHLKLLKWKEANIKFVYDFTWNKYITN